MKRYAVTTILALTVSVAAAFGLEDVHLGVPLVSALAALFLLLVPFFFFGLSPDSPTLRARPALLWGGAFALVVPYLVYGWGTGTFATANLVRLLGFVALPAALVFLARRRPSPSFGDVLAVLAIWLPFDFRMLEGIWVWPEGQGSYGYQAVLAVDLALLLFVAFRGIGGVGYSFRLRWRDGGIVLGSFVLFSAVAIPVGLAIGFIAYRPGSFDLFGFLGSFVAILLFIGIPEELLFRGLIQNFLESKWGRGFVPLLIAAVIFGAAHLNNGDAPNWNYALMATIAGLFYGLAFRLSGVVFASALVHALVDAVWRAFFR